jgi:uncharacterized membrane protein YeaQ/YmgE (transglycosylase-associated protein family)
VILSIIIGILAGFLAAKIMGHSGFGIFLDLVVGFFGGIVGRFAFGLVGIYAGGIIGSILVSTVGAVMLIWIVQQVRSNRGAY